MSFAENTSVPVERSRAEIETLLRKYGAEQFVSGWSSKDARIQFFVHGRYVRFVLELPDLQEKRFTVTPRYGKARSQDDARRLYEQEVRRLWRSLTLVVKAKLEAVESKIATFENEFMANIVMPDGKTVSEHVVPMIAKAYESGKMQPLLSGW